VCRNSHIFTFNFNSICEIIGKGASIALVVNDRGNTLVLQQGSEETTFYSHVKDRINTLAAELGFDTNLAIKEVLKDVAEIGNEILNEDGEETE
jgi:diaminopimelate epimerase